MAKLILLNKPFDVLSQFTDAGNADNPRKTLSDFVDVPKVYPAGRLDRDSEGLLLLTDDGKLQARISNPKHKMNKVYWAQVEGIPDEDALNTLRNGVELKDGMTQRAKIRIMDPPEGLWPRNPPIRERKNVPDSWIELIISEGRNRQVRRMTAAVGHPTLRLVRARIGRWSLDNLQPGEWISHDVSPQTGLNLDGEEPLGDINGPNGPRRQTLKIKPRSKGKPPASRSGSGGPKVQTKTGQKSKPRKPRTKKNKP